MNDMKKMEERFKKGFEKSIIGYPYADTEEMTDELDHVMEWSFKFMKKKILLERARCLGIVDGFAVGNKNSEDYGTGEHWSTYGYDKACTDISKKIKGDHDGL